MQEPYWQLVACLVCGHLIGDFWVQTKWLVRKKRHLGWMLVHTASVGVVTYLVCGMWELWMIPLFVFLIHTLVDQVKIRIGQDNAYLFAGDQALHLLALLLLGGWLTTSYPAIWRFGPHWNGWVRLLGPGYIQAVVVVGGVILATKVGGILIGYRVRPLLEEMHRHVETALREGREIQSAEGLENGGELIGMLERFLIFLLVLIGQPNGIGFLIAAKSIMRFGEIKDSRHRMQAEYIIIGTFMSFAVGIIVAYGIKYLLMGLSI